MIWLKYRLIFQIIIVFLHRNKLSYSSDMEQIIGRKTEMRQLTEYYHSGKAEFVAVYGRRRIGKTYLVHNLFKDEFAFEMSGSIDAPA